MKEKDTHIMFMSSLPRSVCLFWEESGSAEHLQDRRTITPPSTPSSLAKKGEPRQKWLVITSQSILLFSFDYYNKNVLWIRSWTMPISWQSPLFLSCIGLIARAGWCLNRGHLAKTVPDAAKKTWVGWSVHYCIQNGTGNTTRLKDQTQIQKEKKMLSNSLWSALRDHFPGSPCCQGHATKSFDLIP